MEISSVGASPMGTRSGFASWTGSGSATGRTSATGMASATGTTGTAGGTCAAASRDDRAPPMPAHPAKGREFPVVLLVGTEEGIFPHAASSRDELAIEEERRLCYVGMTRAMERLTLTWARKRRRFGSQNFATPSRFLTEIPASLVDGFGSHRGLEQVPQGRSLDYSYDQTGEGSSGV